MTDDEIRERIAAMTLEDREELVTRCEEAWRGTPWQWRAELMRSHLDAAKRELN